MTNAIRLLAQACSLGQHRPAVAWLEREGESGMTFVKQIGGAAALGMAMVVGAGLSAPKAEAAYIVTLAQVGANVIATGSGFINLAGLSFVDTTGLAPGIFAQGGDVETGAPIPVNIYTGFTGPASFGSGNDFVFANSSSGDPVGVSAFLKRILVPKTYVSNAALSDSATYLNANFSTLGVTPGNYLYTFGSGANADSFTVKVGVASVPEPASLALLVAGMAGLVVVRRRFGFKHS